MWRPAQSFGTLLRRGSLRMSGKSDRDELGRSDASAGKRRQEREDESSGERSPSMRTQVSGWKSMRLWVLSQKGLSSDSPQRQSVNQSPGGTSNSLPSWSTSFAGP